MQSVALFSHPWKEYSTRWPEMNDKDTHKWTRKKKLSTPSVPKRHRLLPPETLNCLSPLTIFSALPSEIHHLNLWCNLSLPLFLTELQTTCYMYGYLWCTSLPSDVASLSNLDVVCIPLVQDLNVWFQSTWHYNNDYISTNRTSPSWFH